MFTGGIVKAIIKLLGGGFLERTLDRIIGNKSERDIAYGREQEAVLREFGQEFRHLSGRTKADVVVDVINRLPRPLFAISIFCILVYAPIDPAHFAIIMQAYALVPEWLALLMATIITFFFGGRALDKWNGRMKAPSINDVKGVVESMDHLRKFRKDRRENEADMDAEAIYKAQEARNNRASS